MNITAFNNRLNNLKQSSNYSFAQLKDNQDLKKFLWNTLIYLENNPDSAEQIAHFLMGKSNNLPVYLGKLPNLSQQTQNMLSDLLRTNRYATELISLFGIAEAPQKTITKLQILFDIVNSNGIEGSASDTLFKTEISKLPAITKFANSIELSIEYWSNVINDRVNDATFAQKLLAAHKCLFDPNIFQSMVKTLIKNCSDVNSTGEVRDPEKAMSLLREHNDQFGQDIFQAMVKSLIEKCSGITRLGLVSHPNEAIALLTEYKDLIDPYTFQSMVQSLIEKCSAVRSTGYVRHPNEALTLLSQYNDLFDPNTFQNMLITLIKNCSGVGSQGDVCSAKTAMVLLTEYKTKIDKSAFQSLVTTLITNCSGVRYRNSVRDAKTAMLLLTEYAAIIGENAVNALVKTLIENCSSVNLEGYVLDEKTAILLLTKYKDCLVPNTLQNMVKTLIQNCSRVGFKGGVCNTQAATFLLTEYKDQFDRETLQSLVKTLIVNCSSERRIGYLRDVNVAKYLLTEYKDLFDPNTLASMVKPLIENCSGVTILGGYGRHTNIAISLLSAHKELLASQENQFYQHKIVALFNRTDISNADITELLREHGDNISSETIINRYLTTNSIDTINAVRDYVQGIGAYREINLPPRNHIMVADRRLQGIAHEVHNYTNGTAVTMLKIISFMLHESKVANMKFTVNDLRQKFKLLDLHKQNKCNEALDKIIASSNYKEKLKAVLPALASFLNADSLVWEHNQNNSNSRWKLWLEQSFYEAGTAYTGENNVSCVKGIYERLFSGFRTMHPCIDVIFAAKNILEGYRNNILNILKGENLVNQVIASLKVQGIKSGDENFDDKLKEIFSEKLSLEITNQIYNSEHELKNKLSNLPNTKQYIAEFLKHKNQNLIREYMQQFNACVESIEYISLEGNTTLYDYIQSHLTA